MVDPSLLITMELGRYGSRRGTVAKGWVKSSATTYSDWVLAMYSTVLLVPGATMFTEFEVTGLPLPRRPIWLYEAELQLGGWQIAVIAVAPASGGTTVPKPAGIVVGEVDTYSRF